ncbi:MAG: sodium:alanine symporter family protein [Aminobacterium sp.]|uniref:alanine/glycine:cation symporter family protein n=1 Tax=unclassified Aminobacterium TaxID=2685012 RepID=UPI001BCC880F|nr:MULTISPECIES: sodium:alanine symporter family protein [unclassified Aminobacterium]MDD2207499.1 sodium:alanine symporter family protein [Aminobacterium sp.]MDD3426465.1 sodium:alanine symporter family protein [Aminobacterium sp.]MDD3708267.1 sodium:alanine symporter family protein [Aminobacterium sp.]MDD4229477.1 sodium:alanine symporter family protein [Aminobacterium sp.]MDD4552334.1 sodium:alanine symporter family protein [Aminobacterium sp.]
MEVIDVVRGINNILWSYVLIFLLCGTGIYFTFRLNFVQIRKFGAVCRNAFGGLTLFGERAGKEGMSSFQSLATAIAAQVGTGNLAGAATAIASGGPGAIFWMWISAFFGMSTIFSEAVLAQTYKEKDVDGQIVGGPAYYISRGFGSKGLAVFFAIAIIIALGFIGNMVQSNSISDAFQTAFNLPALYVGIAIAILAGLIFFGGISRIASFTEKAVPIMALMYLIGGVIVLVMNADAILPAIKMIFYGAFNPKAATGGIIGVGVKEAVRYGVARGLFSNEAGMGSTPHAHAVAKVNHPAQQGLVAIMGVFIDTFIVLNITAFVILTTGVLDGKTTGIALTQAGFTQAFGGFGNAFVAICLLFFAFSTIIGWYFFGEANIRYLFGIKGLTPYRILVMIFIVIGSTMKVDLVWELADTFNGLMVIPNLIAVLGLAKVVSKALDDYDNDGMLKSSK